MNNYEMYASAAEIINRRNQQIGNDSLEHHGILGMKWGIRRFQNEDGTLTPKGKERYLATRIDLNSQGEPVTTAVGDADLRRVDLENQTKMDAITTLLKSPIYRTGAYVGAGSAASAAAMGTIGALGLVNPAVAAASAIGFGLAGGIGYNVAKNEAKKETGLNDMDSWTRENMSKYGLNTRNLGYDVKWTSRQEVAKFKNQRHQRGKIDDMWRSNYEM